MESRQHRPKLWIGLGLVGILLMLGLGVGWNLIASPTRAQELGKLDLSIKKTLMGSEVVRVGQILTFKIVIENTGNVSITHIAAEDRFVHSIVAPSGFGPFAKPDDPPLSIPAGRFDGINTIVWDNLVESLPGAVLAPGETIEILVHLRAVHPSDQLQIVNEAHIREAVSYDLRKDMEMRADAPGKVRGNQAPVTKKIANVGEIAVGTLVTFTIGIRNDGLSPIRKLPLGDEFNPSILEFVGAIPPPDLVDPVSGSLQWNDLLVKMGKEELAAQESIEVITTYRAKRATELSANKARVSMAQDEYGNILAPQEAHVPIRIVPGNGSETATPTVRETPTLTATAMDTPTPTTATLTPTATTNPGDTPTTTATVPPTATAPVTAPTPDGKKRTRKRPTETPAAIITQDVEETDTATAPSTTAPSTVVPTEVTSVGVAETATSQPTPPIIIPRSLPRTSEPSPPPRSGELLFLVGGLALIVALGLSLRRPQS